MIFKAWTELLAPQKEGKEQIGDSAKVHTWELMVAWKGSGSQRSNWFCGELKLDSFWFKHDDGKDAGDNWETTRQKHLITHWSYITKSTIEK